MNSTSDRPASEIGAMTIASPELDVVGGALSIANSAPDWFLSDVPSWHAHIPFARALVSLLKPRRIVELGVHKGDSFLSMADALKSFGIEGEIFGIDTWQGDEHAGAYAGDLILEDVKTRGEPVKDYLRFMRCLFDDALPSIPNGSVDLLHIDGLHTYEAVKHDFDTWREKLGDRGVVMFHDTIVRTGDFGVWRFWSEIEGLGPSWNFPFGNGLGVLCLGSAVPSEVCQLITALNTNPEHPTSIANLFRAVGEAYEGRSLARLLIETRARGEAERLNLQQAGIAEIERLNREIVALHEGYSAEIKRLNDNHARLKERAKSSIERLRAEFELLSKRYSLNVLAGKGTQPKGEFETGNASLDLSVSERLRDLKADILDVSETIRAFDVNARRIERLERENSELKLEIASVQRDIAFLSEIEAVQDQLKDQTERLKADVAELQDRHGASSMTGDPAASLTTKARLARVKAKARDILLWTVRTAYRKAPVPETWKRQAKVLAIRHVGQHLGIVPLKSFDLAARSMVALRVIDETPLALSRAATGRPANLPERSVSIVVPVYNNLEYTTRCISAIHRNTAEIKYEIIIVDDASSDNTEQELSGRDDIIYIRNSENKGFIGSCNAGAERATMNYICFLNNDTEVAPYWLSTLVNTFEMHDGVGMAGSKLIYPDGRLQEAGGIIWDDFSGWNWGRLQDPDDPRYEYARKTDYCSGASILLPRALVTALGGFDPAFAPAYGEDSDLAFRVRALGLSTIYQPLSRVIHYEGITSGTDINQGVKAYQVVNAGKLKERWAPVLPHQGSNGVNAHLAADRGVLGRILVIDQISPEPDKDAGSITALEIMRGLRDLGYKVTFIPCSNFTPIKHYTDLLDAMGIESVLYPWCATVAQHLKQRQGQYDAVLLFRMATAQDHLSVIQRLAPNAKIIFHTSDLHFVREERAKEIQLIGQPNGSSLSPEKTKLQELAIIASSSLTIVHSHFEKELLGELLPKTPVEVFPWIFEPRGAGKPFSERRDIVFVGGYRHHPNIDAVDFYARDLAPVIERTTPGISFRVIGSHPPASFTAYAAANPRIVIDGFVADIEPILFGARMMLAPLRYGAGLKGKIVTAMAHGLPVITTTIGAEGMALTDGENVLIADDPEAIARAVNRLETDRDLWEKLSRNGLSFVSRTTSRAAGYDILRQILNRTGLRTLPAMRPTADDCYLAALGTPAELVNSVMLSQAFAPENEPRFFWCPAGVDIEGPADWRSWSAEDAAKAKFVGLLVDLTDDEGLRTALSTFSNRLSTDATVEILFVPPRLIAGEGGYRVEATLSGLPIVDAAARTPAHLRYIELLESCFEKIAWRANTTLRGFPTVLIARCEKVKFAISTAPRA